MELKPYSFSRLSEFERCPKRFEFKYIQKLPEILEDAGHFGKIVHEAIARLIKNQNFEEILKELEFEEYERAKNMIEKVKNMINGLKIIGVEVKFSFNEDFIPVPFDSDDVYIRGIIDMIVKGEHGYIIYDWKTGYSKPNMFQLLFYAWAASKLNLPVEAVGFVLLNSGEIETIEVNDELLDRTEKRIKSLVWQIENTKTFEPKPGLHCAYCSYIGICPLAKELERKDIPSIRTIEEAKQVAKELKILEEKKKRWEKILKGFLSEQGIDDLEVEDNHYKLSISEVIYTKRNIDKKEFYAKVEEKLTQKQLDKWEFFKLETKKLKDLIDDDLKDFVEVRIRKTWGWR